jgi:hypothetical protein
MLADARKVQHFDSKLGSRMDARRIDPRCCDSWPARIASFTLQQPFYQRISYSPTDDNSSNRMGLMEKIKEIEAEMARTQKNKATNYHLGEAEFVCVQGCFGSKSNSTFLSFFCQGHLRPNLHVFEMNCSSSNLEVAVEEPAKDSMLLEMEMLELL